MPFTKVGKASEVPAGGGRVYEVGDRSIAVFNVDGALYAIDDICTHAEASLQSGYLEDCEIECPLHGARFDIRTGEATELPAVVPVDTFPVRVEGGDIELDV